MLRPTKADLDAMALAYGRFNAAFENATGQNAKRIYDAPSREWLLEAARLCNRRIQRVITKNKDVTHWELDYGGLTFIWTEKRMKIG